MGTWLVVLIVIATIAILTFSMLAKDELLHDPFLPYADLLSKEQVLAAVQKRNFSCAFVLTETAQKCSLKPDDGLFSEIYITIKTAPESVFFDVARGRLRTGDLILLWGQPGVAWPGSQAVLSWAGRTALVCALSADRHLDYYMPICYVSFEL